MSATMKLSDGRTLTREQTLSAIRNKNTQVIKEIATSDFDDGGLLNRQQFAEFYQEVIPESNVLGMVRTVPVDGPESQIDQLGVGENLLRAIGEGEAVDDYTPDTSSVNIDVEKVGFGWDLRREVVEDTIEYGNTAMVLLSQFSDRYRFDLEKLAFQGDAADTDDFYGIMDGWSQSARADDAEVRDYDADDTTLDEGVLFDLSLLLDDKYVDATNPAFFAHPKQVIAYRRSLADRETSIGDDMLETGRVPTPTGYPLIPSSACDDTEVIFTDPNNLVFAPHRDIRVDVTTESEKVVKNDLFAQYAMTSRIDFAVEKGEAVAIAENLDEPAPEGGA